MKGFLAWDVAAQGPRPGVLVVHEWWGHNEHARNQAKRLARAGYVGFAVDMFGAGKVTTHPQDAKSFVAEATQNPQDVPARFSAAFELLVQQPQVDPQRTAAIGYCFGGSVVLGLARSGADLDAVVTFHAALAPRGASAEAGRVKARILVLNGAEDPMVTKDQVESFEKEMRAAGARFEVVNLPGARHSFTNPEADKSGVPGLAYSAEADEKSWQAMLALFKEVFASPAPAR